MFKNVVATAVLCFAALSAAHAVDINSADREALTSIKGIGSVTAQTIVAEREANGAFTDAKDLAARVRGIGEKMAKRFTEGGLTFGPKL
ncbi:helix-hairpin-helix domain-containing protein [Robbsia sp. Bb-Pol-6]|uniref:Helix-hairpin-helix domain-containing protein n=1 Tax=Robbsia betulipollinis TaxID=2981849 RepID=A0ABT3ZPZ2_9BURK|nr:helix-hairpin-helix domain-containing protein [Robbsia betulipollinis]MCY0388636.1 helix-hairpin-helix domain-containing protein [Robbsia betulipollinis]